jgi:CRISPR-associated protein Cas2
VWLCVMFDLPVLTKGQRHAYSVFRKKLLKDGFSMLQYSIYVRHCATYENAAVHVARVDQIVPNEGVVNILSITDKQYSSMITYWGKQKQEERTAPSQLEMF